MGREIKRVPLDFAWPLEKVWGGFLNPHYEGHCSDCTSCGGSGLSPRAKELQDKWYGYAPFHPSETGSEPFLFSHPVIVAEARRSVTASPGYYGSGELAVATEAVRLADLFNSSWLHHLDSDDVAALLKADRLWDFTRVPRSEDQKSLPAHENGWLKDNNGYVPTPKEVNEWSIRGFGHDSINCWIVVQAKAKRLRVSWKCRTCKGEGSVWDSPDNKAIAESWKSSEPPTGDGWQMWETVSEGSPVTPVFATAAGLVDHLVTAEGYSRTAAERFIETGWVMSAMSVNGVLKQDIEALA